jgi:hypothetical protein
VPENSASVYEICGPGQWADLVGRYPLDVTRSRRDDWRRATGRAGGWLIPDYAAMAADWDAVHVSVAGYLTTAGIAILADDGACTMLAGWDPDATWWLTGVLSSTSQPEDWRTDDQAPSAGPRLINSQGTSLTTRRAQPGDVRHQATILAFTRTGYVAYQIGPKSGYDIAGHSLTSGLCRVPRSGGEFTGPN